MTDFLIAESLKFTSGLRPFCFRQPGKSAKRGPNFTGIVWSNHLHFVNEKNCHRPLSRQPKCVSNHL
jgi:hypothetical protein